MQPKFQRAAHGGVQKPRGCHRGSRGVTVKASAGGRRSDLNASATDNFSPLHCAAGRLPTALLLVRLGASLSLRDDTGRITMDAASGGDAAADAAYPQLEAHLPPAALKRQALL